MIDPYRRDFNSWQFSERKYGELVAALHARTRTNVSFPICETPCFFSAELMAEMEETGRRLTHKLIDSAE